MKRSLCVAALLLLVAAAAGPASADPPLDCTRNTDAQIRLAACTTIIDGPAYSPEQKAAAYRGRAAARLDAGAVDQAIADFTQAVQLQPRNAAAYAGRAQARLVRGEVDVAIADFDTALLIAGDQPAAAGYRNGRGHALHVKGQYDAAIADFTEALRLNPRSASAHNNRGLSYRTKGDTAHAIEDYTAAIALNPVYAQAYANRGYVYESSGNAVAAIADFDRALMLDATLVGAADGLKRLHSPSPFAVDNDVLALEGQRLVEVNCSRCHATGATGDSPNPKAPPFRTVSRRHPSLALREPLSRGIAAPHDEMPHFKVTDADVDKIIAYINSL